MLTITIPDRELFDEENNLFLIFKGQSIVIEHSLVSISKWESKWKKPFISDEQKTQNEIIDYIRCMTITQNVDENVYLNVTDNIISEIKNYIDDSMTATWFNDSKNHHSNNKQITSELIYYWMITLNIPVEFQKWHLNRLLTLIKVCNEENKPPRKSSVRSLMSRNAALNAARRKQLNSKG